MGEADDKLQLELASFRQQWHEELLEKEDERPSLTDARHLSQKDQIPSSNTSSQSHLEEKAVKLFLKGVELEQQKKLYEAITYYRQAVHLYPDVEAKIAEQNIKPEETSEDSESENHDEDENIHDTAYSGGQAISHLSDAFQKFVSLTPNELCSPATRNEATHISVLPTELLVNIMRWLVSADLDLRSLMQASLVCKWFYFCARDPEIWRRICIRLWGMKCGSPVMYNNCWRNMYIRRPHLHYSGVYISKYSYVRPGEQSLDEFYRPYHIVEYYRYLRFYVDGSVLVYTSADDPKNAIALLERRNPAVGNISKGHYRLTDDTVSIIVRKILGASSDNKNRRTRGQSATTEQTFYMELSLKQGTKRKRSKLEWLAYSCDSWNRATGIRFSNVFDLKSFTPFYFSRIKTFQVYSHSPL